MEPIHQLGGRLRSGALKAVDLLDQVLRRVAAVDGRVGAYLRLTEDEARKQAEAADRLLRDGGGTPLTGIPIAIKDNISVAGQPLTCGSRILANFISPYDATVVERLRAAGAVFVGKTNMDEFAMGSSTENSALGVTRNPWALDRIPGGSSGGSAAAVAAGECVAALGSDTGGSIRQPAACCGVVGLKPTYGRVSRYGLVAFASSLDQVGPITQDVRDAALLFEAIAGLEPCDSTSADFPVPGVADQLADGISGARVGVPKEYFIEGIDPEVERAVREAIAVLEKQGARITEISLPHTPYAIATYYILATAEASSNLARYDGVRYGHRAEGVRDLYELYARSRAEGFGQEVKRRIMLGTYALSSGYYEAYYHKAQQVRTLIKRDFDRAFDRVHLIVTPTAPTAAFRLGEKVDDPLQMYLSDIFTISVNLAGIPAVSLPCGFTSEGLPIGLQILGRPFDETTILKGAYAFEQATEWHSKRPSL